MRETPACADLDDDTMFPEYEHAGQQSASQKESYELDVEFAKSFCFVCPSAVRRECLVGALARREEFGVWGGLDTAERDELLGKLTGMVAGTVAAAA